MLHVETFIKTGELTQEAYQELNNYALTYLGQSLYHRVFLKTHSELTHDMAVYVIERISKYAPEKQTLKYFIDLKFKRYLWMKFRSATQLKNVIKISTEKEPQFDDDNYISIYDLASFQKYKESVCESIQPQDNKAFVEAALAYWQTNLNNHFRGNRLNIARHILDLLGDKDICNNLKGKRDNYTVMKKMNTINKALYVKWNQEGKL